MDVPPPTTPPQKYTVQYRDFHTKELIKVSRQVPPKIHDILPTDTVRLSVPRNEDWKQGESFAVRALTQRNPNVLQLEKPNGETTFVNSQDVELISRSRSHPGVEGEDTTEKAIPNRYLLWP